MTKLALGTAQFGMNYGISNTRGQVSESEIERILTFCKTHGICTLDTAQGYGESEAVLGRYDLSSFKIVTKLSGDAELEDSLCKLNVSSVDALLFHREDEINDTTWQRFENWKRQKLVHKIGVSVYSPQKLSQIMQLYPIDIVQLPLNILDQRFIPLLPELKQKKIEVHTRSVFLQGLLLMNEYPTYFDSVKPVLQKLPEPKLLYALHFALSLQQTDKTVVGVTCLKDLEEIYKAAVAPSPSVDYSVFFVEDEKIINPSLWSKE
ncbi:aldo/keto reductase [Treponema sp. OMZ 840]|uniref:aldo/keto reductase n=1 Tax=Treponema sp. OMZ 840 TaxID=244313 RepID=UPI003D89F94C